MELNYNKPYQTQPGDSKVTTWLMAAGRLDCYCWGIVNWDPKTRAHWAAQLSHSPLGDSLELRASSKS